MTKVPLEQTIKEYFDQYGAILVGMHQDLQSQQATIDRKISEAEERSAASRASFDGKANDIVARVHGSEAQLAQSVNDFDQRTALVVAQVVSSAEALATVIRQGESDHQQRVVALDRHVDAAIAAAKLHVDDLKEVARKQGKVFEAELGSARERFAQDIAASSKSFTDHVSASRSALATEINKVRGQIQEAIERHQRMVSTTLDEYRATNVAQRQWFEEHSALLSAQSTETIALLQEIDAKTVAHQQREAAFNKRLRQLAVGILVVSAVGVLAVVTVWKP